MPTLLDASREAARTPGVVERLKSMRGRRRRRVLTDINVAEVIEKVFQRAPAHMVEVTGTLDPLRQVMCAVGGRGAGRVYHRWGSCSDRVDVGYFPEHGLMFVALRFVTGYSEEANHILDFAWDRVPLMRLWLLLRPDTLCFSVLKPADEDSSGEWSFAWLRDQVPIVLLKSTHAAPTVLPMQELDLPLVEEPFGWLTLNEIATPRVATTAPLRVVGQDERSWSLGFLARKLREHGPGALTKDLVRLWHPRLLDRPWISEVLRAPMRWPDLQALVQPKPAVEWTLRVLPERWKGAQRLTPRASHLLRLEGRPTLWKALLGESTDKFHPAVLRRKINDVAVQSGHPITLDTAGWARFVVMQTNTRKQFVIEEIQSDLHQAHAQIAKVTADKISAWFAEEMGVVNAADLDQMKAGLRELSERMQFINAHLLSAVLDYAHALGFAVALMPNVQARKSFGGARVPHEVYDDLPRRYGSTLTPSPIRVTDLGYEHTFHQLTVGVEAAVAEPQRAADQELADDFAAWADNLDLWLASLPLGRWEVWREGGRTSALIEHGGRVLVVDARSAYVWWQEGGGSVEDLARRGRVSSDPRQVRLFA